jgi:mono/diheme cytochrome c family protein
MSFTTNSFRVFFLSFFLVYPIAHAFDGNTYFEKNCSSCHTVGAGEDIGPDLKGILQRRSEAWLIKFIQSSQDMIQSGDATSVELFNKYKKKKMPDQDLSDAEVRALIQFIAEGGPKEKPLDSKPATEATEADIVLGEQLFLGRQALANGGASCISCHGVGNYGPLGGGSLGPDLSQAYSKYEDKGLAKALAKAAFPVMRHIYGEQPLTDEEAFAIKAFLYKADQEGVVVGAYQKKFIFLGLGGAVIAMGVIDFTWRKRRKKTVKPRRGGDR